MKDLAAIMTALRLSPAILDNLLVGISEQRLKQHRIAGKWSIHEHACHLAAVQSMLIERLNRFKRESAPVFHPFIPGQTAVHEDLLALHLKTELAKFAHLREKMLAATQVLDETDWHKRAKHPEYSLYTPYILLRHVLCTTICTCTASKNWR